MKRLLSACLVLGIAASADAASPPIATQFSRTMTIDAQPVDVVGRVVVVNFWATWCAPCRVEMPMLDAYYRAHRDAGLTIVAVALDAGAPVGRIRAATAGFAMPIVPMTRVRMARGDIPNGLPVTRIYDRHGRLRFDSGRSGKGTIDAATLDGVVAPLLREP